MSNDLYALLNRQSLIELSNEESLEKRLYPYSGCSKSHQMISYESRSQLVFPLLIGKAQAPVQLRINWKECAEIKETR